MITKHIIHLKRYEKTRVIRITNFPLLPMKHGESNKNRIDLADLEISLALDLEIRFCEVQK